MTASVLSTSTHIRGDHMTIARSRTHQQPLLRSHDNCHFIAIARTPPHDNSVDDIFAEVVEFVEGHDCMPIGEEEFDEIVWEMALAVKDVQLTIPRQRKVWWMDGFQWKTMNNATTC